MTHKYPKTLIATFAAGMALPTLASAFDYNYVEGGYLHRDTRFVDDSGFRIAGSGQIAESVALIGEYSDNSKYEQLSAGVSVFAPITQDVHWTAAATAEFADSANDDDVGFGLRGGLRWRFARAFELNPEIRYIDVFDDNGTSLRMAGLFDLTPNVAVQAALQGGHDDRVEAGLRYNFAGTAPAPRRY